MKRETQFVSCVVITGLGFTAAVSGAYVNAMQVSPTDPSTYGSLVQELDVLNTAYSWPIQSGAGFTNSGYLNEVLDGGGNPMFVIDRTEFISRVYEVTSPQVFGAGADQVTLNAGDMVFEYRIRLTGDSNGSSTNVVNTTKEFLLNGLFGSVPVPMAADKVKGRGIYNPDGNPVPVAAGGDFTDLSGFGDFGGSLDWAWLGGDVNQLDNGEFISLLMFTEPTLVGSGLGSLAGSPGQESGVDPNANGIPILIPVIPTPGTIGISAVAAGLFCLRRRR